MDFEIPSSGALSQTAARQADFAWRVRAEDCAGWTLTLEDAPGPGWIRGLLWRILTRGAVVPPGPELESALLARFGPRAAAACGVLHRIQVSCALSDPEGVPGKVETDLARLREFSSEEAAWLAETARRDISRLWSDLSRLYPDERASAEGGPLFVSWTGVGRAGMRAALVADGISEGVLRPVLTAEAPPFFRDDAALACAARRLLRVEQFRPGQAEGTCALLSGRDLFLALPTGAGKSLCYQLAALLTDGTPLVIAPLRALLRDQARRLAALGISRVGLLAGDDAVQTRLALRDLRQSRSILAFAAPERLDSASFREALRAAAETARVPFVAVDEAHCAARRGHDWRPSYRVLGSRLRDWSSSSGRAPALAALSGGAMPGALAEAERVLGLSRPVRVNGGSGRENLSFHVRIETEPDHLQRLRGLLAQWRLGGGLGPGIVFCPRVDGPLGASSVAEELIWSEGLDAAAYTGRPPAGRSHEDWDAVKRRAADDFLSGRRNLICATRAFGLGVDRSDVRWTVHLGLPSSLEEYFQQAGRAGRDEKPAECWALLQVISERRARRWAVLPVESLRAELRVLSRDGQDDVSRAYSMHLASFPGEEVERRDAELALSLIGDVSKPGDVLVGLPGEDPEALTRALVRLEEAGILRLEDRFSAGWRIRRAGGWSASAARQACAKRVAQDYLAVESSRRASLVELVELALSEDPGREFSSRLSGQRRAPSLHGREGALVFCGRR